MAARIRSLRNGITPVDEASRDDLVVGDVVTVSSLDPATTYAWSITFAPQGSTATFSGSPVAVSPGTFTVDVEGPYLVRLVVDATLPTENTQYVRLRALTEFGQMTLVAAGERRDATGIIPVDADPEGWANDQNYNLQTLKGFIKPFANSGRVLQVDANSGTTGYGDYGLIQDAIDAADTAGATAANQWVILVHPGTYAENLNIRPFIHVVGWPASRNSRTVLVDGTHTAAMANVGDACEIHGLTLNRTVPAATAVLVTSGLGTVRLWDCTVTSPGVGPAVRVIGGTCTITDSSLVQTGAASTRRALVVEGANSSTTVVRSTLTGPSGVRVNDALDLGVSLSLVDCTVTATDAAGFGLSGQANTVRVTQTVFTGAGTAVSFGNPGAAMAEAASLAMSFTTAPVVVFDTNNLAGGSTLNLGSVNYTTLTFPSGAPTTYAATTQARTVYYDNAASGLTSTNVQAAIDEIAGGGGAPPLSAVLTSGNSTGGSSIVLTTGDILLGESGVGLAGDAVLRGGTDTGAGPTNGGDVILRPGEGAGAGSDGAVVVRSANGANSVRLTSTAAQELTVGTTFPMVYDGTTGKLTVPGVIDPTALILSDPAAGTNLYLESANGQTAAVAPAGKGRLRYNNATTQWEQSVNGGAYTTIGSGGGGSGGTVLYQEDVPPTPGSTVQFQGWVPVAATLQAVRVYMAGVNTVGTYTVAVTNVGTGNTCLVAATFDMNTLVAGVVTTLTLTATPADLSFLALGQWTVAFTSNNPGFDGTGIYFDLQFGIGSTGVSGQDIATTLTLGNATGGNDIILTTGDQVVGEGLLGGAGDAVVRGGTPTGGVANGGDVILRPGAGAGGGTDGAVIVRSANAATSVRLTSTAAEELTVGTTFPMVYNGTTGKLTVPGLIDPTGVVFEASTVPTTGATEGAIFVSDGSSSLVSGQLYYRSPSNGSVTPLDRVTWSGTTTDNIATELFVNGVASSRYVLVDDSAVKFTLEVIALSSDGLATGFKVSSVIKRGVGVASTAIVGTPVTETTGSDPALSTATMVVMADTTNGALSILVQGVSLKTIKWVVSMTAATIVY